MKLAVLTIVALALAGSALASSGLKSATITIRHETHGCHSWSLNGTSWGARQTLSVARGSTLAVVDNDVMPHKLIQVSGPKATIAHNAMQHMHATAYVGFAARGTYVFTTKAGEDYMQGIKTTGADNALRLVVKVS